MTHRVELVDAYVLHRRAYSNTSLLIDFFTESHGRIAAVARSARGLKSRYRGKLEMFLPMWISWSGRGELKSLGQVEFSTTPISLTGDTLFCGFYLNEILIRLLHRDDPHPELFQIYHKTLNHLSQPKEQQSVLRQFEKDLLHELGYGLTLTKEWQTNTPITANQFYQYIPDRGFIHCHQRNNSGNIFSGATLLALHNNQLTDTHILREAKKIMRLVLAQHLGAKPIKSRDLLRGTP